MFKRVATLDRTRSIGLYRYPSGAWCHDFLDRPPTEAETGEPVASLSVSRTTDGRWIAVLRGADDEALNNWHEGRTLTDAVRSILPRLPEGER